MEHTESKLLGTRWRLIGAAIAPFVVASAYLWLTRWPSYRFTALSDFVGLAVSVLVGTVFVTILPIRPIHRLASLAVYVPTIAVLLFFYSLWFIAAVFHDGL
jgi:hypothetical protein